MTRSFTDISTRGVFSSSLSALCTHSTPLRTAGWVPPSFWMNIQLVGLPSSSAILDSHSGCTYSQPRPTASTGWQGVGQAKAVLFFLLVAALAWLQLWLTRSREVEQ